MITERLILWHINETYLVRSHILIMRYTTLKGEGTNK